MNAISFRSIALAATFAVTLLFSAPTQAGEWQIDTTHSQVGFGVKHLGVSTVRGTFSDFEGTLEGDEETGKLTKIHGKVAIASVDTNNTKRDDHLKGDDFFAAEKFPHMEFVADSIKIKGDKATITGDLTIRDVTKKVTFTGSFFEARKVDFGNGASLRAGYDVSTTIDRKEFKLSFGKVVDGINVVADDVTIQLEIQIMRDVA